LETDREQLVAYLLGEMPEDAKIALEQAYFTSDESFAELVVVEDELAYDYAGNRLSQERRRRFEATIGATDRGHKNVELARAMLAAARTSQASQSKRNWGVGIAASVLLVIAGGWMASRLASLTREVAELRAEATKSPPVANPVEAAFLLTPGVSRSNGGPARLELRREADIVNFELLAPPGTPQGDYVVEIRANDAVVSSLATRFMSPSFLVRVAAKLLTPGDYEVAVRRVSAGEQASDFATYSFALVRP
jgi:hypothetical protein